MSTDTALIEKREELKRRLAAGEYKTLVDVILRWIDRVIRKLTRRSEPLPIWFIAVILWVGISLTINMAVLITGGWSTYRLVVESYGLGFGLGVLINESVNILFIVSTVVINQYMGRLFVLWRDSILDITESEASLKEFEDWLKKSCNWRLHIFVTLIPVMVLTPYGIILTSTLLRTKIDFWNVFSSVVISIFAWAFLYQFLMVILLAARLRRYDLKLFSADPGSSEVISRLSDELGFFIYYVAIYAAILTLGTSWLGLLSSLLGFALVLLLWLPITVLFILNQTSLSSIIRRAKWKTLNEIQAKVEKLQAAENFEDKETMEAINRLMDYHDRVKATRNSALDFGTYLNFINSLLLPLLAFILGNLDLVLNLFTRTP